MKKSVVIKWYNAERWCYTHHLKIFAKIIYHCIQIVFGCTIPPQAVLENGVDLPHFHGIVIHHNTFIGAGTLIYQNVTIGGGQGGQHIIGKNCLIGAGAVILGDIKIGNNVNIGANAVVLSDVPDNCTIVGVPGRIVKGGKEE